MTPKIEPVTKKLVFELNIHRTRADAAVVTVDADEYQKWLDQHFHPAVLAEDSTAGHLQTYMDQVDDGELEVSEGELVVECWADAEFVDGMEGQP